MTGYQYTENDDLISTYSPTHSVHLSREEYEAKIRADERVKVLGEVEGWLVDEFTEEDEWICPKCGNTVGEGYYCRNDRSKPVKETRKWEDGWQEAKNVLRAELRTKLNQLKGNHD